MITNILIGVAVVIVLAVLFVAMQSSEFRVTRSTTISAAPSDIFPHVNDHHQFHAWSPFNKSDPNVKITYDGPTEGKGAVCRWNGDNTVGEGTCTIVESKPNERIDMELKFVRPFQGSNDVVFTFQPQGERTQLTWDMTGKRNFMMKAMGLVMNMEKMCGDQFEQGLANLKSIVERPVAVK